MPSSDRAGLLLWLREWIPSRKILSLSLRISYSLELWWNDSRGLTDELTRCVMGPSWGDTWQGLRAVILSPPLKGALSPLGICGRASSSLFLFSHLFCIEAIAVPKRPCVTTGVFRRSSLSLVERLMRFNHLALSCRTIRSIALPVAWTAN